MPDSPREFDPAAVQLSPEELKLVDRIVELPVRGRAAWTTGRPRRKSAGGLPRRLAK